MFRLEDLGWGPYFQQQLNSADPPGLAPARVAEELKSAYRAVTEAGPIDATISGRLRHQALTREEFPAIGDWVLLARVGAGGGIIHRVLERRTKLSRKTASGAERRSGGRAEEQILAANVDVVLVVTALNRDFNPRRLERYLAAVWESGAMPVVVLNKADLHRDVPRAVREAALLSRGLEVIATSTLTGQGVDAVRAALKPGDTAVLVGSSGVGKSSLINRLLSDNREVVRSIRPDGKGRHTTTSRRLIVLPGGGVVIDTPGLRELTLWEADVGLDQTFADIGSLARDCAFRDCRHVSEPGCAVRVAIEEGALPEERFASYRKLEREREFTVRRQDKALELAEKKRWKRIHMDNRQRTRFRGR